MLFWDGGWLFMTITMFVFWGLIIWGIVLAVRALTRSNEQRPAESLSAEQILEQRFARGEIDEEEFNERRRVLSAP